MIEPGDVFGLVVKATAFGLMSSLLACHEGLRGGDNHDDTARVPAAACRAVLLSIVAILMVNDCWFVLNYLSGSPFGPTLAR
jgi:ABC-type transporter Mla maintaining outer membrane lipid asymmetry permease subunit MlaE